MPRNRNQNNDQDINITFEWFEESIGKLLVAELALTLLCGACSSSVEILHPGSGCSRKVNFLEIVAWAAFAKILIDLIIKILGLRRRLPQIFRHPVLHVVICGLAVVGFLIASPLVASCAKVHLVYNWGAAVAAAVFGLICLILFAVECYLQYTKFKKNQRPRENRFVVFFKAKEKTTRV